MGRSLASILAELSSDDRAPLDAYTAALRQAGCSETVFPSKAARLDAPEGMGASTLGNRLGTGRRLLKQVDLAGWRALAVEEQFTLLTQTRPPAIGAGTRCVFYWLALTGRQPFTPTLVELLEERAPTAIHWLEHSCVARPQLIARLIATAGKLGDQADTAARIAFAVTKACAYLGQAPEAPTLDDLVRASDALLQRQVQRHSRDGQQIRGKEHQPLSPWTTDTVLYHAGLLPEPPSTDLIGRRPRQDLLEAQLGYLCARWPQFRAVATRSLARPAALRSAATVKTETRALGAFFRWLTSDYSEVADLRQLDRRVHLEPFRRWVPEEAGPGRRRGQAQWSRGIRVGNLNPLRQFFRLVALWGWPEALTHPLLLPDDLPRLPEPLPQAFDDVEAARMVQLARRSVSPVERLIIEFLAGCGLRVGEARDLKLSDLVTFGGTPGQSALQTWLRIPLGKLANDRDLPVGTALQAALDAVLAAERSGREWEGLASPPSWTTYLLAHKGRRFSDASCNRVVQKIAERVGVADAHAHRWRHAFATQAITRGMDLASIATLLGHRRLEITMVYARIASPILRQECERISAQVQAFDAAVAADPRPTEGQVAFPAGALGRAMVTTCRELAWRRLGNGWGTRRAYLDCRYELVCERCVHFNTDRMFLPILEAQHADAARKGQQARIELFAKLITALTAPETHGEVLPLISGPRVADFTNPKANPKGDLA